MFSKNKVPMQTLVAIFIFTATTELSVINAEQDHPPKSKIPTLTNLQKCGLAVLGGLTFTIAGVVNYNRYYPEVSPDKLNQSLSGFKVEQRSDFLTIKSREGLWIHNEKQGFGRLTQEVNRLVYRDQAGQLVAQSAIFAPYGRSYANDGGENFPVVLKIFDAEQQQIGSIEELSRENPSLDGFEVQYIVRDTYGTTIAQTVPRLEWSTGQSKEKSRWKIVFRDSDNLEIATITRHGMLLESYSWTFDLKNQTSVDPRLLFFLTAMKNVVDETRGN